MAGHVDFGDHGDVALLSVLHNLARLLLGVETAVGNAVVEVGVSAKDGTRTLRTDGGELGIFLNLYAPTLIVGQMPVEDVHVVHSQQVDELLDEAHTPEVA